VGHKARARGPGRRYRGGIVMEGGRDSWQALKDEAMKEVLGFRVLDTWQKIKEEAMNEASASRNVLRNCSSLSLRASALLVPALTDGGEHGAVEPLERHMHVRVHEFPAGFGFGVWFGCWGARCREPARGSAWR
jgi:hypothetical protein